VEKIKSGDKIKYCYLKVPNPLHENVIGTHGELPEEFGLTSFIDYDKQFDKSFANPVKKITTSIGWTLEKTATLDEFFG